MTTGVKTITNITHGEVVLSHSNVHDEVLYWNFLVGDIHTSFRFFAGDKNTIYWHPPDDEVEVCYPSTLAVDEWYDLVPLSAAIQGF